MEITLETEGGRKKAKFISIVVTNWLDCVIKGKVTSTAQLSLHHRNGVHKNPHTIVATVACKSVG